MFLRFPENRHAVGASVLAFALCVCTAARADDWADVSQMVRAGRLSEALVKADQYLAGKPGDPQMRFLRGIILTESGRTAEAISVFTLLTQDYPKLPEPYNNLAVLHAQQNQFDKARAALEMAIRTNPSYATAHENLGDVYARLANQAYGRALQLDASNAGLPPKLGLIRELFSQTPVPRPLASASTPASPPAAAAKAPAPASPPSSNAAAGSPATPPNKPAPVVAAPAPARTPAPAPAPAAPAAPQLAGANPDIESAVQSWAAAWSAKDTKAYLASYADDFDPPGEQSRKSWEEERRARILGKSRISVKLSQLQIKAEGDKALVQFRQAYSADSLNINSRKTLEMRKSGERWLIVREYTGG